MTHGRTALVTGGAGFIGSNLVSALLAAHWRVRVLDNFSSGRRENLSGLSAGPLEILEGDIRVPADCVRACEGVDTIFHEAALRSVPRSVDDPAATDEVNVHGTLNILQAGRHTGVRRLVYASSSSVYGDSTQVPQVESQTPRPISPYAVSKLAGEHYCVAFTRTYGLETVSLRYFNVFGPRQNPESKYSAVIPGFLSQIARGQSLEIHGDGQQARDFSYVGDVVRANLAAADAEGCVGESFNVGRGESRSVLELADMLVELSGVDPGRHFVSARAGDVRTTRADISKARAMLGFEPELPFREALARTVEAFRRANPRLSTPHAEERIDRSAAGQPVAVTATRP